MGNVAMQCRNCRGWDVVKGWTMANPYYNCRDCGYVWR